MPGKKKSSSGGFRAYFYPPPVYKSFSILLLISLFFLGGCSISRKPDIGLQFSEQEISDAIKDMSDQGNMVRQFYANGKITIRGWVLGQSADIFMAGQRDPLRIKIEITHSWGKPLLYILIDDNLIEILDYNEKKIYSGEFSSESLSGFFPGKEYNEETIWDILRGYPSFVSFNEMEYFEPGRIRFSDKDNSIISIVDLSPDGKTPSEISRLHQGVNVIFSDFSKTDMVCYAKKIIIEDVAGGKDLILARSMNVFNKEIPGEVFSMDFPANFERLHLAE